LEWQEEKPKINVDDVATIVKLNIAVVAVFQLQKEANNDVGR
jgi:hypothetical protein